MTGMKARLRSAAGAGLLCVAALAALAGCGQKGESGNSTLSVGTPCFIEGVTSRAACHQISVPEDWSKPSGRQVKLNVAVLPSAGVNKDGSALFVLAGGPGQAATHYGDLINKELDRALATRPIILMDQRGTGGSNGLKCEFGGSTLAEVQAQSSGKELEQCRGKWGDVALQHYTTPDVVRDMDAVRQRLGFEKLDIWGASWGTRTALLYMRQYPQHVRSAVLDGVTGPNSPLFLNEAKYAQAALDTLFKDCQADKACASAFPGLRARAMARLQQEGAQPVQYIGPDGKLATMSLEQDMLRQIVRGALYSPEGAARLPFALDRLSAGDATPILAIANSATGFIRETMFHGATFSSLCAEELPRAPAAAVEQASASSFARASFYNGWSEGCAGWPVKPLPAGYDQPVRANVPVLLLSGALDPVTPPASAKLVQAHLPRAWHVIAPASGHNVTAMPCAGKVIAEFIDKADGGGLDTACLSRPKRPPFMVTAFGPRA